MKFKKIMSLLLVLTLISSLLTTVTLLNPTAEDTEATTPAETTNYDTYVMHLVGKSDAGSGIAPFLIIPADNVKAGITYTVNIVVQGVSLNGDSACLIVREGGTANSPILAGTNSNSTNRGTTTALYNGAYRWTAQVTPTTQSTLCIGLRLAKANTASADFYMGSLEVLDSKGNNIAPKFTESTGISYGTSITGGIQSATMNNVGSLVTTLAMESVDTVEDAALKQTLFSNFYTGDSMLNIKMGSTQGMLYVYKKIPANKLKANTKYNLRIRYENTPFALNSDRYFLIREGNRKSIHTNLGTYTTISGYVNCNEFAAEYTTGDTAQDLYIGVRFNGSGWSLADLYLGDMQFVEAGKTENLFAPLSDMGDLYCSRADSSDAVVERLTATSPTTVCNYVSVKKMVLDREKYLEPDDLEAAKPLIRGVGTSGTSYGRTSYVKVPKENVEAGKQYTVTATFYGTVPLVSGAAYFIVRSGTAKDSPVLTGTASTTTALYSGKKWTEKITIPETKDDLYVGIRFSKNYFGSADFYLGNIKLIDENGNNVAPELTLSTQLYGSINQQQPISAESSANWTTLEIVRMDKVSVDETAKQEMFNAFYEGDSMWSLTKGTGNAQARAIYTRVTSDKLTANTKYKVYIKYSGTTFTNTNVTIRDNTTKDAANSGTLATAQHIKCGTYNEYINYYTTPENPANLYIGVYLPESSWGNTTLKIADIQLIDTDGNDYVTPLTDLTVSNLYYSYLGGGITDTFTPSLTAVALKKQALDTKLFSDPVSTDRKMVNVKGLSSANNARIYARVLGVLPGEYKVTYKTKGLDYNDANRFFDVRTKVSGTADETTVRNLTEIKKPSIDEATYSFSVEDFTDIYLGFTHTISHVPSMDFFVENLKLVRVVNGVESENLMDDNLNITTWYARNNASPETFTALKIGDSGSVVSGTVFKITLEDYDEGFFNPEQVVNIKGGERNNNANYEFGKQASGLKAGTYKMTVVEQGVNIKSFVNPFFHIYVNDICKLTTADEATWEKVSFVEGATSSYKIETIITVEEDGGKIYAGFKSGPSYMPNFNAYITELSLVEVDAQGNEISENLYSDLNVRDWRQVNGGLLTYDKYNASSNQSINYLDLGVADANGNGKVDVADIRIVSKLQDAGVEVTDATNIITIRNTLLGKVS